MKKQMNIKKNRKADTAKRRYWTAVGATALCLFGGLMIAFAKEILTAIGAV